MTEQRKYARYKTLAKARIKGYSDEESLLKDISITGCLIEFSSQTGIELNKQYDLQIKPEKVSKVGEFELLGEAKWFHNEAYCCEIGFSIVKSPKGKLFQRYVDYLSWRYSQGNKMTEDTVLEYSPEEK